jgi:hypothetical protein
MSTLSGQTSMAIEFDSSPTSCLSSGTPSINDFVTIVYDGNGGCGDFATNQILTYKIQNMSPVTGTTGSTFTLTLDRSLPTFDNLPVQTNFARLYVYPSGMTELYDFVTPAPYWQTDTLNFETPCDVSNRENTPIWNMNIPWTESPAGLFSNQYEDYTKFGSVSYIGTKEYLGYNEPSGQTDTSEVFYYNSFDEKIVVRPQDQKAIAIIHYTNQTIDFFYGEKFALESYDTQNPENTQGQARNFKLHIPTLMWHKNPECCFGQTFYVDPPGFDNKNLFKVQYTKSTVSENMNQPGLRYYNLWDTFAQPNGLPSRIGKVYPDSKNIR